MHAVRKRAPKEIWRYWSTTFYPLETLGYFYCAPARKQSYRHAFRCMTLARAPSTRETDLDHAQPLLVGQHARDFDDCARRSGWKIDFLEGVRGTRAGPHGGQNAINVHAHLPRSGCPLIHGWNLETNHCTELNQLIAYEL